MGDPHFRRNLIYVAAFHLLLVAALFYFARREIRRPTGDIVWMDPGSFSQVAAAQEQEAAAEDRVRAGGDTHSSSNPGTNTAADTRTDASADARTDPSADTRTHPAGRHDTA